MSSSLYSVVEYFSEHERYRCGYCKSKDSNYSYGMWAHKLTVQDYQNLIDRGWRRSGKYCYKPNMKQTCCPQYTIRCNVLDFKLSKSQKKVLKRMHNYLAKGIGKKDEAQGSPSDAESGCPDVCAEELIAKAEERVNLSFGQGSDMPMEVDISKSKSMSVKDVDKITPIVIQVEEPPENEQNVLDPAGVLKSRKSGNTQRPNIDPDRPPCKKAKVLRRERRLQKLVQKVSSEGAAPSDVQKLSASKKNNEPKSLEDFIFEPLPENAAHKLEIRTVVSNPMDSDFRSSFKQFYDVYRKYQITVHLDSPDKCTEKQFTRFLVNSPLQREHSRSLVHNFGSYHQQYWLDDKLIAVGVIDILPQCVSSVYLFYDPDYNFLSLGTYASLREIAFVRELQKQKPDLKYYYMGFYIHSCPKMRYKGQYYPSYLLCPETYTWHPIEQCTPKLDISKYSRFEEDLSKEDEDEDVNFGTVMILHQRHPMPYEVYRIVKDNAEDQDEEVSEYATLVGNKCAQSLLLYRT